MHRFTKMAAVALASLTLAGTTQAAEAAKTKPLTTKQIMAELRTPAGLANLASRFPACDYEDGSRDYSRPRACLWDAGVAGNGEGESFLFTPTAYGTAYIYGRYVDRLDKHGNPL